MQRYKLTIEYDGTRYCGFQRQSDQPNKSVEEVLTNAIRQFSQSDVKIFASGRTDSGVHALGQVVHFDLDSSKEFSDFRIMMGINRYLTKEDIAVIACEKVASNFHSRFSATMRHYRYVIINRQPPLTIKRKQAWHVPQKLDIIAMQEAANFLIGEHDFSSFRDAKCSVASPIKNIQSINIIKRDQEIYIEISARSFLHHMVRNITGTLVWIGIGKLKASDMEKILAAKKRTQSGPNAPAHGLYFLKVDYSLSPTSSS